jgi:DNA-binding transcriptional MerR regulator
VPWRSFTNCIRKRCGSTNASGLLKPSRSQGNTRLYTDGDLERLDVILTLARDMGVNLAGIEIILNMREKMIEMEKADGRVRASGAAGVVSRGLARSRTHAERHAIVRAAPRITRLPIRQG